MVRLSGRCEDALWVVWGDCLDGVGGYLECVG